MVFKGFVEIKKTSCLSDLFIFKIKEDSAVTAVKRDARVAQW